MATVSPKIKTSLPLSTQISRSSSNPNVPSPPTGFKPTFEAPLEASRRVSALLFFFKVNVCTMASSAVKPGILISLQDLNPSSPLFKQGSSLRVTGKLQEYSVETAIALIVDGCYKVKIDTQHLRDLNFRVGSIYQFIGELLIQPDNVAVLQARVGRNVDGIDLNLYYKSLQLLTQFQSEHMIDD